MQRSSINVLLLALLVACAVPARAHMYLAGVYINGAQNTAIVYPHPTDGTGDSPVSDKTSQRFTTTTDMICGLPTTPPRTASSRANVAAGSTVALQWWHAAPNDDVVDASHRGPCSVWLAKSDTGAGNVWFKIYEEGYNNKTSLFCNDRIRQDGPTKGQVSAIIPADITAGNYLLRGETWALHEGYTAYGAQPYVGCAQITVTGGGTANPAGVGIVGLYKSTDPSLAFNIYNGFTSYPIPVAGVPVYKASNVQVATTVAAATSTATSTPKTTTSTTAKAASSSTTSSPTCVGDLGCACNTDGTCSADLVCSANLCLSNDAVGSGAVPALLSAAATLLMTVSGVLVATM